MKKRIALIVCALAISVIAGSSFRKAPVQQQQMEKQQSFMLNYAWYYDPLLIYAVGSYSSVSTEILRLYDMFPGYIFSSTWYLGLHAFEYGYYPFLNVAIIYSDIDLSL